MIKDIRELTRVRLQAVIDKAEIKGKGVFKTPVFDLEAIEARAELLDPKSQIKADIYMLIMELEKMKGSYGSSQRDTISGTS